VLVIADPDMVVEVFVNTSKLLSHRRSFVMSKTTDDPNADIFTSNGMRWLRVRYGLEKVMLNVKNVVKCLDYMDDSFANTFTKQPDTTKSRVLDVYDRCKLLMVQAMFGVIFGTSIDEFVRKSSAGGLFRQTTPTTTRRATTSAPSLFYTRNIAHKFGLAFKDFESFSLLKFVAVTVPELEFVWRLVDKFKRTFNAYVFALSYFADPMDWFFINFIQKHFALYASSSAANGATEAVDVTKFVSGGKNASAVSSKHRSPSMAQLPPSLSDRGFGYFNSFLFLCYNPIIKYHQNETTSMRKVNFQKEAPRNRALTIAESTETDGWQAAPSAKYLETKRRSLGMGISSGVLRTSVSVSSKTRHYSSESLSGLSSASGGEIPRGRTFSTASILNTNDIESSDFDSWKLTVKEALSNALLMFFAGYETTSSALGFCCHVLAQLPEQREKLLDEIRENWSELSYNLKKHVYTKAGDAAGANDNDDDDDDDVFEEEQQNFSQETATTGNRFFSFKRPPCPSVSSPALDQWNELYDTIEKMKYLDMFVKEVLRMFPIAGSMVSRKCMLDNLILDDKYRVPKDMNIVVDVMSIHYDPVWWGPVDPHLFYPERFLSERHAAAWLPFGRHKQLNLFIYFVQI
jgi:hypothetical protein